MRFKFCGYDSLFVPLGREVTPDMNYVYVRTLCGVYYASVASVVTYLFHDHSPDGDIHSSVLLRKLLAVTRATKLTLSNRTKP